VPRNVYDHVLEFLKRNHGRRADSTSASGIPLGSLGSCIGDEILNEGDEQEKPKESFALLDRYIAFSAECLRLALLGIGAIGFLITNAASKAETGKPPLISLAGRNVKGFLCASLVAFGLCVAFSLLHRLFSAQFILVTRKARIDLPIDILHIEPDKYRLRRSIWLPFLTMYMAAGALCLGSAFLALAFIFALYP
jgi:hypothetical protein